MTSITRNAQDVEVVEKARELMLVDNSKQARACWNTMVLNKTPQDEFMLSVYNAVSDAMYNAGGAVESKYRFADHCIDDLLQFLQEDDANTIEKWIEGDERYREDADGSIMIYNSDLTEWLNESLENLELVNECAQEYGIESKDFDLIKLLQMSQGRYIEQLYYAIASALKKLND